MDMVPAEYKELPWIQDIAKTQDPHGEFFKWAANAQSLIGKQSQGIKVPGEGASPEEVKAFNAAFGVPEDAKAYKFDSIDVSKEPENVKAFLTEAAKDTAFQEAMRTAAHAAGMNNKQFAAMANSFEQWQLAQVKANFAAQEQSAAQQMEAFKGLYGEQADAVKRIATETASKVLPENIRKTGDAEINLIAALNFIHEKLYKNDTLGSGGNQGSPAMSKAELQNQIFKERAKPEFKDPWHPNYKAHQEHVNKLYEQLHAKD
ncbi:MAG: hypothetical protein KGL39_19050 [Patescibacteria group bacterium]|nr:hypothetical protein [Patescibacteria group bacterium]